MVFAVHNAMRTTSTKAAKAKASPTGRVLRLVAA